MTDRKTVPKKQKVGSLFFHLFNRLSLWFYTLLIGSLPARLVTSYDALENRWSAICTRVLGAPDGKFRQAVHRIRLRCAHWIERSVILRILDRLVKFLLYCPLNVYGIFFFIYGAVGAAVYFVAERLSVSYAGELGWGIAGAVIAFAALPLIGTSKPLIKVVFGSRIIGKILRYFIGAELPKADKHRERANTFMVYAALIFGMGAGAMTFFFHPVTVPLAVLLLVLAIVVLYVPECGVLLACGTIWLWWMTGYPMLCVIGITVVTLISYANKLIRGRRVMYVRLIDFIMLLLVAVFALQGVILQSGVSAIAYGVGYALLIAVYFPVVNLMRSREWLNRCYKLLIISGSVLAVISIMPVAQILQFLDMTLLRVDLSIFAQLFNRYDAYFGQHNMVGGMLLLLLPMMLSCFVGKRTITGFFWKLLWVVAGCAFIVLSMQLSLWIGLAVALLTFFFVYSYRTLSTAMLVAFPVGCGLVWREEIDGLLQVSRWRFMLNMRQVIVTFADDAIRRQGIARGVLRMSADHLLGVGFGDQAVYSVLAHYAEPGMEAVAVPSTYLQLLLECGYHGVFLLLALLLVFVICVMTYMRWGGDAATKVRAVAGLAGVGGVLVSAAFCNYMNNASLFGLLWLVIGLTVASLRTQYETHARAVQSHASTWERSDIAFRTR